MRTAPLPRSERGTSMIEVLVTIVVLSFGLLGLAGMQSRLQVSEVESYQRTQALILLDDMANRLKTNRHNAANYDTASPLGTDADACVVAGTRQEQDSCEWQNALLGAAERNTDNDNVGAMVGARGCISDLGNNTYLVTVAWQGLAPISAPPAGVTCGQNLYDGVAGSQCANDMCRRALTTTVRMAVL